MARSEIKQFNINNNTYYYYFSANNVDTARKTVK